MTTVDNNHDETKAIPKRESRGVRAIGCDLRVSGLSFSIGLNGLPDRNAGHATVEFRTDMWRFWLEDAIDAALAAAVFADQIPTLYERFEAGNATDEDLDQLAIRELIASMRAISACAFAIDAFYASVKARSPKHPHQDMWHEKGTARHKQVADTFRVQLHVTDRQAVKEMKSRVSQVFRFRDWAVHPGSKFRPPLYRADLNVALDWHFTVFRRENAVNATAMTVQLIDSLVAVLDRGCKELAEQKQGARRAMDAILDRYESADILPDFQRVEPPKTDAAIAL
jgi:hypothetical protein